MRIAWKTAVILASPIVILLIAAWIYAALYGVRPTAGTATVWLDPHPKIQGFPWWLRLTHYVNLLFITLLVRSGLQILWDHPRLYWNVHSLPGTAWLRFTPDVAPKDPRYTSLKDAGYLSPWIGVPGGQHKVGLARHWHFLCAAFWIANGLTYVVLLFATGYWHGLIPTSWGIVPAAWKTFVTFACFQMPHLPDAFSHYDPLQKLAYGSMVFIFAPLTILTGAAMSPALVARFPWYERLFVNRQVARSLHFLLLCNYLVFLVIHVTLVARTGFAKGMNHILLGTPDESMTGVWVAAAALILVIAVNVFANRMSRAHPRLIQHLSGATVGRFMDLLFNPMTPHAEFQPKDISPYFWANGRLPSSPEWQELASDHFKDYRLKVFGLVENPVELSLADLKSLGKEQHITQHYCIQGWSGIAEWGGVPMQKLLDLVRPLPNARFVVFHSFAEGEEGGTYYDSDPLEVLKHPQTLLAYEMNYQPLSIEHGAPLRLRLENKLGFKMVKWIKALEFVEDYRTVFEGEGGYHEDREYYGYAANV